jgi:hypothetical protein
MFFLFAESAKSNKDLDISIVSTNTEYIRTRTVVNDKYESYDISIELFNKGPQSTDNLTVKLIDEEDFSFDKKININSTDQETVTFENILLPGEQTHSVEFQIIDNQNNTLITEKIYFNKKGIVDPKDDDSSEIPGFEIILILIAIISILIVLKRNQK